MIAGEPLLSDEGTGGLKQVFTFLKKGIRDGETRGNNRPPSTPWI
jgi:hypothetical protein